MAGTQPLIVYQGEDRVIAFELTDGGSPLDITGWTLSFKVWTAGNESVLTKTPALGGTPSNGECSVTLAAADLVMRAGRYLYELRRTGTGTETPLVVGIFDVKESPFVVG